MENDDSCHQTFQFPCNASNAQRTQRRPTQCNRPNTTEAANAKLLVRKNRRKSRLKYDVKFDRHSIITYATSKKTSKNYNLESFFTNPEFSHGCAGKRTDRFLYWLAAAYDSCDSCVRCLLFLRTLRWVRARR